MSFCEYWKTFKNNYFEEHYALRLLIQEPRRDVSSSDIWHNRVFHIQSKLSDATRRRYSSYFYSMSRIKYTLFYKQRFFKSASVLLNVFMNGTLDVASVLLNTCNHHYTETHFILSIFVSMSRPRSIYVVSIWSIFHFQHNFITINYITSIKHVLVLCTFFRMSPMICGWWMKKVSNFQIAKVQSQGVA